MFRKKGIFSKSELRSLITKKHSCVVLKSSVIDVYLLPYYLNDVVTGLWNALYKKLKTYDSKLEGILLGYENIKVDLDAGRFCGRNAEIKYPVSCDCFIFQPSVGKLLQGKVNQMSSDHIGCIVHEYFNATIKRSINEDREEWNNRLIDYEELVTFRVKDLDYTGLIPYIEGELDASWSKIVKTECYGTDSSFNDRQIESKHINDDDFSFISSTQLPIKDSKTFSDSGLEFDSLSPIPALNTNKAKNKKKKDKYEDDEDLLTQLQINDVASQSNSPLKKKSKKRKNNSDEVESSTESNVIKTSKVDIKSSLPQENNGIEEELAISKKVAKPNEKKSSEVIVDKNDLKRKLPELDDRPTKKAKVATSKSISQTKSTKTDDTKDDAARQLSPYSDTIESVVKWSRVSPPDSTDLFKKKSNSNILKSSSFAPLDVVREKKSSSNKKILKCDNDVKPELSPYSDAIESVIKQNISVDTPLNKKGQESVIKKVKSHPLSNISQSIESVIQQHTEIEENKPKSTTKISTEKNHLQTKSCIESVVKQSLKPPSNETSCSPVKPLKAKVKSGKASITGLDQKGDSKSSEKKPKLKANTEDDTRDPPLSPYSDAIESVVKQGSSDETPQKKPINKVRKKDIKKESLRPLTPISEINENTEESKPQINNKTTKITKSKKKLQSDTQTQTNNIGKGDSKKQPLSPVSEAIECVIRQNTKYLDESKPQTSKDNVKITEEKKQKKLKSGAKESVSITPSLKNTTELENNAAHVNEDNVQQIQNTASKKLNKMKTAKKVSEKSGLIQKPVQKATKKKDDDTKKLAKYLKKLQKIAAKGGNQDLLQSLLQNSVHR